MFTTQKCVNQLALFFTLTMHCGSCNKFFVCGGGGNGVCVANPVCNTSISHFTLLQNKTACTLTLTGIICSLFFKYCTYLSCLLTELTVYTPEM